MKKRFYFYCDMDGVVADFDGATDAKNRFATEKGFFKTLKPIKENIDFMKWLVERGESVRILSASPNEQADNDKKEWLKTYMPFIKEKNMIFVRIGDNKADFVKTKRNNILFDDYGKNCQQWNERKGFQAVKVNGLITYA